MGSPPLPATFPTTILATEVQGRNRIETEYGYCSQNIVPGTIEFKVYSIVYFYTPPDFSLGKTQGDLQNKK